MAITKVFDIANRSLAVYRKALDVTSHNIANANNPNFSRQKVIFASDYSDLSAGLVWGNGVKIADVRRYRDTFIESQTLIMNSKFNDNKRQSELITNIEKLFAEPSDLGLGNMISKFFSSFSELAAAPTSNPLRTAVVNAANNLANKVNNLNKSLNDIKENIRLEFNDKVKQINKTLLELNQVNKDIKSSQVNKIAINDLLDNRDRLLAELSKLANIHVVTASDNTVSVSIGGSFAVDSFHVTEFEMNNDNGILSMRIKGGTHPVILTDGELNALSSVHNQKVTSYKQKLDRIVNTIVREVNNIHSTGYTKTTPPQTGLNFFEEYRDGVLRINQIIVNNPNLIAISSDGSAGNGDLALRISEIVEQKLIDNSTIMEYYTTLINEVGNDGLLNKNLSEANQLVLDQLEIQKQQGSGVSLDEEMTNVLQFQRSYEASAKLIKVSDELLKTILELV
jgi:flagellar hook-associated protein 1 FlgK